MVLLLLRLRRVVGRCRIGCRPGGAWGFCPHRGRRPVRLSAPPGGGGGEAGVSPGLGAGGVRVERAAMRAAAAARREAGVSAALGAGPAFDGMVLRGCARADSATAAKAATVDS